MTDSPVQPIRIQLQRRRGWRIPANTVSVARPHKWSNPFTVQEFGRERAIELFRALLQSREAAGQWNPADLRGKNLACFCRMDEACHADVLLAWANATSEPVDAR